MQDYLKATRMIHKSLRFSVLLVLLAAVGCGGTPSRPIQGKVTLDGAALPAGEVVFLPVGGGTQSVKAEVKDGAYKTECPVGKRRVQVFAYRESAKESPMGGKETEQYIPAVYNDKSTLEVNVEPSGKDPFDFDLKSK